MVCMTRRKQTGCPISTIQCSTPPFNHLISGWIKLKYRNNLNGKLCPHIYFVFKTWTLNVLLNFKTRLAVHRDESLLAKVASLGPMLYHTSPVIILGPEFWFEFWELWPHSGLELAVNLNLGLYFITSCRLQLTFKIQIEIKASLPACLSFSFRIGLMMRVSDAKIWSWCKFKMISLTWMMHPLTGVKTLPFGKNTELNDKRRRNIAPFPASTIKIYLAKLLSFRITGPYFLLDWK